MGQFTLGYSCWVLEIWGWAAGYVPPHAETLLSVISAAAPSPGAAPVGTSSSGAQSSWLWQFSTGPALGGVLALAAAVLAFIRLGHQVAEVRRGNNETARRNIEDQWWDTLKWTYAEAKESQAKDSTFRTVAAVNILDSLNQDHDQLTHQQQRAVRSILDIFGESKKPEVQDAVASIYGSFGRMSPFEYEQAVIGMFYGLTIPGVQMRVQVGKMDGEADLYIASNRGMVAVEIKSGDSPVGVAAAAQLLGMVNSADVPGLLITQGGITQLGQEFLENSLAPVSALQWQPGMSTEEVRNALADLLQVGS
jgi:hypothetical protein